MQDYVKQHLPTLVIVATLLGAMQGIFGAPAERRAEQRFERMEARLDRIEIQFEIRFDKVDERFREVDRRFDGLERTIESASVKSTGASIVCKRIWTNACTSWRPVSP